MQTIFNESPCGYYIAYSIWRQHTNKAHSFNSFGLIVTLESTRDRMISMSRDNDIKSAISQRIVDVSTKLVLPLWGRPVFFNFNKRDANVAAVEALIHLN